MKRRSPFSVNNSLVHGICNCNCITCTINKENYHGPKALQSAEVTRKLTERIREANREGIRIRYITISGSGEPTLHPEFGSRMDMFGKVLADWDSRKSPAPEISVVTNGLNLLKPDVLPALARNRLFLKFSFPTSHPEHYGEIMMGKPELGPDLIAKITPAIEAAMRSAATGELRDLEFHVSPPYHKYIRMDLQNTLEFLTRLAQKNGMPTVKLMIFPNFSNRAGNLNLRAQRVDWYSDFKNKYRKQPLNGVRLQFDSAIKKFFRSNWELVDLLMAYDFPCLWYGSIFVTPKGDSCCCNDQNVEEPLGNVQVNSLREIMELKERKKLTPLCDACDQKPGKLSGTWVIDLYTWLVNLKTRWAERRATRSRAAG